MVCNFPGGMEDGCGGGVGRGGGGEVGSGFHDFWGVSLVSPGLALPVF